jgi:hypothetical protein
MSKSNENPYKNKQGNSSPKSKYKFAFLYNFGTQYITFVVLVTMLVGGLVGYFQIRDSRNNLQNQLLSNNLSQAVLASEYASNYINLVQNHMLVFSRRPDIKQFVLVTNLVKDQFDGKIEFDRG